MKFLFSFELKSFSSSFWWFFLFSPSNASRFFSSKISNFNKVSCFCFRFAYVVVRTTGNSTTTSNTSPTRTEPISHIPTIASSNKIIKGKQSKDDVTKRASVRRTTIGRSKLSRSPVKPLTCTVSAMTPTNQTVTTTIANSQSAAMATTESNNNNQTVSNEQQRVSLDEVNCKGPITRSRLCKLYPSLDDSNLETMHKRGKRSLSNSRFYEKKNTSRKKQILAPVLTGTSLTRKLRKEASLDSALADVVTNQETNENPISEVPSSPVKEAPKSRLKKPSIRSASQKTSNTTTTTSN